jgi:3-oxoadipate enol-lactonase
MERACTTRSPGKANRCCSFMASHWTRAFAGQYRVIRLDLRGYGRSAVPTADSYRHVDDVKALLDTLGVKRAILLGLSMGGGIALDFTLTYPEIVRALIVVDSVLKGFHWSIDWSVRARELGVEGARQRWLAHPLFAASIERADVASRLTQIVNDYSGWHWYNRDPDPGVTPAIHRLAEITVATQVIVGERDLPDFRKIADTLAEGIANARKDVLPGLGHLPNMEAPDLFNEVVLNFLVGL